MEVWFRWFRPFQLGWFFRFKIISFSVFLQQKSSDGPRSLILFLAGATFQVMVYASGNRDVKTGLQMWRSLSPKIRGNRSTHIESQYVVMFGKCLSQDHVSFHHVSTGRRRSSNGSGNKSSWKKGSLGRRCFYGQVDEFSNWWLAVTNVKLGSPLILQETQETPILLVQKTPEIFSHGRNGVENAALKWGPWTIRVPETRSGNFAPTKPGVPSQVAITLAALNLSMVSTGFSSSCLTESHNFHIKHFHPKNHPTLTFVTTAEKWSSPGSGGRRSWGAERWVFMDWYVIPHYSTYHLYIHAPQKCRNNNILTKQWWNNFTFDIFWRTSNWPLSFWKEKGLRLKQDVEASEFLQQYNFFSWRWNRRLFRWWAGRRPGGLEKEKHRLKAALERDILVWHEFFFHFQDWSFFFLLILVRLIQKKTCHTKNLCFRNSMGPTCWGLQTEVLHVLI